jgi:hypothetical protein
MMRRDLKAAVAMRMTAMGMGKNKSRGEHNNEMHAASRRTMVLSAGVSMIKVT